MFESFFHLLDSIPELAWNRVLSPVLGGYDGLKDHNPLSFVFYWREIWHLLGGILIGVLSSPLFLFLPVLIAASLPVFAVAILIGAKEFVMDASEQPNGWDFKNVLDTLMWTSGAALISFTCYFLITKKESYGL